MKTKEVVYLLIGVIVISLTGASFLQAQTGEPPLQIANLAIPESLGKIEERYIGTSDRWVIHIQDVHAHLTAQENIAAIIDHLNAVYRIETVGLEGGWSSTRYPIIWGIPTSREKQMLARSLLEDNYITGPTYAAMFTQTPILLVGLENSELYEKNRQIYLKHLQNRSDTLQKIKTHNEIILSQKNELFNPELMQFDTSLRHFHEGKKADDFIPQLIAWAEQKDIDVSDLDQIQIFIELSQQEASIRKEKLQAEANRLMSEFKRKRLSFEELLRSGLVPDEKLEFYPETRKYFNLMKMQDKLAYRDFFDQIDIAVKRVKEILFISEEERSLNERSERFDLAQRIILFEATPDDFNNLLSQKQAIEEDVSNMGLDNALEIALEFYDIAKERDSIFFEKIKSNEDLSQNIAIVTGGFHTEGLHEHFKESGISHIIITPELGEDAMDDELYVQRLSEELPATQTLSDKQNRDLTERFEKGFEAGIPVLEKNRNLGKAKEVVKTFQVGPAVTATPAAPGGEFSKLPNDEQLAVVNDLRNLQTGTKPITIVILASELANNLFPENRSAGEVARTGLHKEILSQNRYRLIVLQDDMNAYSLVQDELLGKRQVKPVPGQDIQRIVEKESERYPNRTLVVVDPKLHLGKALVVPPHPAIWFVVGPYAEYGDKRIAIQNLDDLAILQDLLWEIYSQEGVLRSA